MTQPSNPVSDSPVMYLNVQNPDNLESTQINLSGGYRIFVPSKDSEFYAGGLPIHLGHVRNPEENYDPETKEIPTSVWGIQQTALELVTKVVEGGSFETISALNPVIRGLWAGSRAVTAQGAEPVTTFAADTAYPLGALVQPTTPNGHYYEVTTAGTTSSTEPTGWSTAGGTNVSGDVTFTDRGLIEDRQGAGGENGNLVVIPRTHKTYTGMMIDVTLSALDRPSEIYVAPNVSLRGNGYAGGRNSEDETALAFEYTVLAPPATYKIPTGLGDFGGITRLPGGYDILGIIQGRESYVVDELVKGYYA